MDVVQGEEIHDSRATLVGLSQEVLELTGSNRPGSVRNLVGINLTLTATLSGESRDVVVPVRVLLNLLQEGGNLLGVNVLSRRSASRRQFTLSLTVCAKQLRDLIRMNHILLGTLSILTANLSGRLAGLLLISNKVRRRSAMNSSAIVTGNSTKRRRVILVSVVHKGTTALILKIGIKNGTSGLISHTNLLKVLLNLGGDTSKTGSKRVRKSWSLLPHGLTASDIDSGKNRLAILPADGQELICLPRLKKILANRASTTRRCSS